MPEHSFDEATFDEVSFDVFDDDRQEIAKFTASLSSPIQRLRPHW